MTDRMKLPEYTFTKRADCPAWCHGHRDYEVSEAAEVAHWSESARPVPIECRDRVTVTLTHRPW